MATQTQSEPKCALVTGSSNGIGEAIVKELAKLDYKLVVTGRSEPDIRRVAEECRKLSPTKQAPLEIVADLADEEQVERLFSRSLQFFQNKLHLLVNNAGYGQPVAHDKPDECYQAYRKIMQINLDSVVKLCLLAGPILKETARLSGQKGNIINISSIAAFRPSFVLAGYATSKAALNMFSQSMAVEMAPLVRVNLVSPGPIETKILERSGYDMDEFKRLAARLAPLQRIGQSEEVARGVLFLADNSSASYITGANLTIDGGTSLSYSM